MLRRILRLSGAERRLLARALATVACARVVLSVFSFSTVQRMFGGGGVRVIDKAARAKAPRVERIAWSVRTAGRYVPKSTCLVQALATRSMMARFGYRGELRLGVGRDGDGAFGAHAWIEYEGRVVIGDEERGAFTPLPPLEGTSLQGRPREGGDDSR